MATDDDDDDDDDANADGDDDEDHDDDNGDSDDDGSDDDYFLLYLHMAEIRGIHAQKQCSKPDQLRSTTLSSAPLRSASLRFIHLVSPISHLIIYHVFCT